MASAQFLPFPAPGNGAASISPPIRQQNSALRSREHLVAAEVDKPIATARAEGADTRTIQAYLGHANITHRALQRTGRLGLQRHLAGLAATDGN